MISLQLSTVFQGGWKMQKKNLIVSILTVAATLWGTINAVADKTQSQQDFNSQEQQLEEIEKYILQRRLQTEDFYLGAIAELQLRGQAESSLLEVADKGIYASLAAQTEIANTVLQIKSPERCSSHRFKDRITVSPVLFALAQAQIAQKKNNILAAYELAALDLEKQKRYALTVKLPELEKQLKEYVLAVKPETPPGVIAGIVYSDQKPSAIIDGQIVHEKDTVRDITVAKIYREKIEFEKNGKKWAQKVQETVKAP
jgi:hypothetical protein